VAFKDILLVLITYPQATDTSEIQEAVSFAVAVDAQISALACVVQVRAPSQHLMSDAFVGALVASEREKSSEAAAKFSAARLPGEFDPRVRQHAPAANPE
jgi:hypothetical protein